MSWSTRFFSIFGVLALGWVACTSSNSGIDPSTDPLGYCEKVLGCAATQSCNGFLIAQCATEGMCVYEYAEHTCCTSDADCFGSGTCDIEEGFCILGTGGGGTGGGSSTGGQGGAGSGGGGGAGGMGTGGA